jgi:ATP-binding protein involved in chromosome partitioning
VRIVIPLAAGQLCAHFGHCEQFAVVDVDPATGTVEARQDLTPPPHEPGALPPWLAGHGANVVIAGGIGMRAQQLLADQGIEVVCGAAAAAPEAVVQAYLAGELQTGENLCDH